jgi:hypothetical protein
MYVRVKYSRDANARYLVNELECFKARAVKMIEDQVIVTTAFLA